MQLKHLFVFLLMFLLSVAESTIYAQENTANYHQLSKVIHSKKISYRNTKRVVFKPTFSCKYFLAFHFKSIQLKGVLQKQIQHSLKLQKQLYQHIAKLKNQHIFLISKITASNSISNLYIA